MFRFFEHLIDPVALPGATQPPHGTVAFFWHFVSQKKSLFLALVGVQFVLATLDAALPVFVGMIVNRLSATEPAAFFQTHWLLLTVMLVSVLVIRPATLSLQFLLSQQAINPGFSSMVRWQSHWHVVRQSWPFFQADFAGRVANKVMQVGYAMRSATTTAQTCKGTTVLAATLYWEQVCKDPDMLGGSVPRLLRAIAQRCSGRCCYATLFTRMPARSSPS